MSSSDQVDVDEAADRAASAVKDAASTSSTRNKARGLQLRRQFGAEIVQALTAVLAIGFLSWALDSFIGLNLAFWLFAAFAGGALIVNRVGGFSIPFALTGFAVLLLVGQLLPPSIAEPLMVFPLLFEQATGFPIRDLDPWRMAVILGAVIPLIWFLDVRIFSGFRRADGRPERTSTAKAVNRVVNDRLKKFLNEWREVIVAVAFVGVVIGLVALQAAGQFAGEAGGVIAEAPVVFAALVNWVTGFLALGGQLPIPQNIPILTPLLEFIASTLAGMNAGAWGLLTGAIIVTAYAVRETRS